MFEWMRSWLGLSAVDDSDRDTGEDEYESEKEEEREISPSGETRVKTDGL